MKKFERFIIYPLLIVALFYAVTGGQTMTIAQDVMDRLVVREISVVDDTGEQVVNIGSSFGGGAIMVFGPAEDEITGIAGYGVTSRDKNFRSTYYTNLITIAKRSETDSFDGTDLVRIGLSENIAGMADFYNSKGDQLIGIGPDTNGHGLINIYDKYGEDFRSYRFR